MTVRGFVIAGALGATFLLLGCAKDSVSTQTEEGGPEKPSENLPPIAVINGLTAVRAYEEVSYSAVDSDDPDGTIERYEWDYGDGKTDAGRGVRHMWLTPGTYVLTLRVIDNLEAVGEISTNITVDAIPFEGTYNVQSHPATDSCNGIDLAFPTSEITITIVGSTMKSDWHLDGVQGFSNATKGKGQISGVDFTQTLTYEEEVDDGLGLLALQHTATWKGVFNDDGTFDSHVNDKIQDKFGLFSCTIKWPDVRGMRIGK